VLLFLFLYFWHTTDPDAPGLAVTKTHINESEYR